MSWKNNIKNKVKKLKLKLNNPQLFDWFYPYVGVFSLVKNFSFGVSDSNDWFYVRNYLANTLLPVFFSLAHWKEVYFLTLLLQREEGAEEGNEDKATSVRRKKKKKRIKGGGQFTGVWCLWAGHSLSLYIYTYITVLSFWFLPIISLVYSSGSSVASFGHLDVSQTDRRDLPQASIQPSPFFLSSLPPILFPSSNPFCHKKFQ